MVIWDDPIKKDINISPAKTIRIGGPRTSCVLPLKYNYLQQISQFGLPEMGVCVSFLIVLQLTQRLDDKAQCGQTLVSFASLLQSTSYHPSRLLSLAPCTPKNQNWRFWWACVAALNACILHCIYYSLRTSIFSGCLSLKNDVFTRQNKRKQLCSQGLCTPAKSIRYIGREVISLSMPSLWKHLLTRSVRMQWDLLDELFFSVDAVCRLTRPSYISQIASSTEQARTVASGIPTHQITESTLCLNTRPSLFVSLSSEQSAAYTRLSTVLLPYCDPEQLTRLNDFLSDVLHIDMPALCLS